MDNEQDLVVFTDDDGNELTLEVRDYFFYNGQEYAVLADLCDKEDTCEGNCESCDEEEGIYIMKVVPVDDDQEEFVPVDESLMDELIDIVETRFESLDDDEEFEEDSDDDSAEMASAESDDSDEDGSEDIKK